MKTENAVKVKPVTRQELLKLAVTDADAFTALRFLRHRDATPAIPDLEEKGAQALPGIEGSLLDLYQSLWSPEPVVKDEVPADRRYWQKMLGEAVKSTAYGELHAETQFKELQSVLGTISMGESVVAMVPEKDKEKLQKVQEAQKQADEAEEQAQERKAEADALQNAADDAAQDSSQGGSGQGQMSAAQAKAVANELAKQAGEAKAIAESANQTADEAKLQAEIAAEELLGKPGSKEADEKLRELARIGMQAVKNAHTKVEEVSKTIEAWGLEEGELSRKSIPETLGMLEKLKRNEALKKFASILGRIRMIAAKKARSKISGEGVRVTTVETGRNIKRAHRSELVALIHPALRAKALKRWTAGELRLSGEKTKRKLGSGPVIVCEDGSGSMQGSKQMWAKAVTLSLAHYAKIQKRSFGWVHFGAKTTPLETRVYSQGKLSAEEMLELAETFRNASGTDFEKPLRKALEMIRQGGLKKADICLITDGECAVSDEFLREFNTARKALDINVFTVICDVGTTSDATVRSFSDRVEKVSAFTAEEAETKLFRHL